MVCWLEKWVAYAKHENLKVNPLRESNNLNRKTEQKNNLVVQESHD